MNSTADGTVAPTVEQFLEELIAARLLAPERSESLSAQFQSIGLGTDRAAFANFLVEAGHLTAFQADRALDGQAARLTLGPYVLLDQVGNGSFGQVYRALSTGKRGRFAVKQLPLRSMWNVIQAKKQVLAFRDLPSATAVVPFVDIDTAGDSHYLVWPFVEGETFDSLVRRNGPLHPDHVVKWMTEVLQGLAICHKAGIAHGLLKPGNLLLSNDRSAKILDLGIGAILAENISDDESMMDTISTSNTAMSTIDCAAPETLANPTVRTAAGDLYSLGCVMYYLLSGSYPFPDGNIVNKMIAHQTEEPKSPCTVNSNVPDAIGRIVLSLLRKDPAQRPHDVAGLIAELRAAASDSTRLFEDVLLPEASVRGHSANGKNSKSDQLSPVIPGDSHDCVDFDVKRAGPTVASKTGLTGRVPGPKDSAAVDYFGPREDPMPAQTPISPAKAVPASDDQPRRIVLSTQGAERAGRPSATSGKTTAKIENPVAMPASGIQWAEVESLDEIELTLPPVSVPPPPIRTGATWTAIRRRLFFWRPPYDLVQFSLFGPTYLAPGQTYQFQVCAHMPEAFAGVRTLSRAFRTDAELRAAGYGERLIRRGAVIGLHLAVANAGVAQSMLRFVWVGQSKPWKFEVYVPWESPAGRTPGVLSVGLGTEAIAQIPFNVIVMARSS